MLQVALKVCSVRHTTSSPSAQSRSSSESPVWRAAPQQKRQEVNGRFGPNVKLQKNCSQRGIPALCVSREHKVLAEQLFECTRQSPPLGDT